MSAREAVVGQVDDDRRVGGTDLVEYGTHLAEAVVDSGQRRAMAGEPGNRVCEHLIEPGQRGGPGMPRGSGYRVEAATRVQIQQFPAGGCRSMAHAVPCS